MKKDLIESLMLKATPKYNDNEIERAACLEKAKQLAEKYNLMNLFDDLFKLYFDKRVKNEFEAMFGTRSKSKTKPKLSFEEFMDMFYINRKGNLVLRLRDNRYITIVRCSNGSYLVRGDDLFKFCLTEMIAYNIIYENINHEEIERSWMF